MTLLAAALVLAAAYLIGAIPSGLLLGKWLGGIDLREHGSRNIGFTNAMRVLGWRVALPVLVLDVGKAWAATVWLPQVFAEEPVPHFGVGVALAVLAGNMINAFLGFKGGKGVATGLGVFLGLAPLATMVALLTFLVVLGVTRYVSLGSMLATVALALVVLLGEGFGALFAVAAIAALAVIVKHRTNIRRLLSGTESRVGRKTK